MFNRDCLQKTSTRTSIYLSSLLYNYSVEASEGNFSYTFTTDNSIEYVVFFATSRALTQKTNLEDLYILSLLPVTFALKYKYDKRIFHTVKAIVNDFFNANSHCCSVIYYPDDTDGKDAKRDMLFNRWFSTVEKDGFRCVSYRILGPAQRDVFSTTLLFHELHPDITKVTKEVNDWQVSLNLSKVN